MPICKLGNDVKPIDGYYVDVYHPEHYTSASNGVECIDAIFAALERYKHPIDAWLVGQIIKYLWRAPLKGKYEEDIRKAGFYLNKLIERAGTKIDEMQKANSVYD